MSELAVAHQCDPDRTCGTFICEHCERCVPWCFGAADEYPEWCDDCCVAERERLERLGLRLDDALEADFDRAIKAAERLAALPDATIAALDLELEQIGPAGMIELEARLALLEQSQP